MKNLLFAVLLFSVSAVAQIINGGGGGGSMVYPGAGIPNSTGAAWGTSYTPVGGGTSPILATLSSPSTNDVLCENGSSILVNCTPGVPVNAQTGTTYTFVTGDRGGLVTFSNAASIAVTLPQAGGTGFASNWYVTACDLGAGTATITPTTSTINGNATLVLKTNQCADIYSDNSNYRATLKGSSFSGSTGTLATTSGTLTSGNCVKIDANGNLVDNGGTCGGGSSLWHTASSTVTTVTTGTFSTLTVPAATLTTAGQTIHWHAAGVFSYAAGTGPTFQLSVGGVTIGTYAIPVSGTGSNVGWHCDADMIYITATTTEIQGSCDGSGTATNLNAFNFGNTATFNIAWSGSVALVIAESAGAQSVSGRLQYAMQVN